MACGGRREPVAGRSHEGRRIAISGGFYGRALVFGEQLQAIVGPTGHIGIATTFDDAGQPDFWGWVDSLPESLSREVAAICPPGSRSGH